MYRKSRKMKAKKRQCHVVSCCAFERPIFEKCDVDSAQGFEASEDIINRKKEAIGVDHLLISWEVFGRKEE